MLQYAELGNFSLFLKPSYLPFSVGKFTRVRGYIPPPASESFLVLGSPDNYPPRCIFYDFFHTNHSSIFGILRHF